MTSQALEPAHLQRLLKRLSRRYAIARMTPDRAEDLHGFLLEAYRDQPIAAFRDADQLRAHWDWATRQHPSGPDGPQAWACLKEGRIVGYFGMAPAEVRVRSQMMAVCWGRDLIVAPEGRSAGVGPLLICAAVEGCGRPFLIAGLNEAVYSIYRRMGFTDLGRIPLCIKVLDARRFVQSLPGPRWLKDAVALPVQTAMALGRLLGPRAPSGMTFEPLRRFDERFDHWWKRVETSFPCVIRRDSASMNWRYFRHPRHRYTAIVGVQGSNWKGVAVVRHGQSRGLPAGFITELLAEPADRRVLAALLREAEEFLVRSALEPLALIRCATLNVGLKRAFVRAGYIQVPSPLHFMMASASGPAALAPLAHREYWLINGGDSDLDAV